ncbi:hypothetical protein BCR33DRAFT_557071 [Rhizoclosmatium globosum]|uniref:Uncharacterized protein n=1 Tax=Rhizoclosmatium globosum TaxID=329046 RepID=A0A1Y2CSE9_9FUNG|nr:hypothetical protein BCR33DRAFT_557071 [Rhizoclosmatium globosum]|eukprot:ORY49942.1 hypothetical protein BCR33DRAFT_557071 [Rhizoclosmatium globosum]
MIGTATPKYPFEMVKDHHYSFASVYEPRAQPSRGSISHSINPMQRPPSTWMASHRQSRAVLDSQLLMLEPPASTQPSSPVPELPSFNLTTTPTIGRGETGVRWDAEDYIKSDEFLNVDAAPVTLRKSATMMHKSGLNRSKKRDVGSISSITIGMLHRPTSWMGSQKSNNVLPTERDRSGNTEEEPTGLAASISKGLGSLAAGLGRAIPTIAVKSQSSLRYHQESIQSPQSQLSVVGDGVSKQPHYLPPGLGEPTVSGLQRTPSFGSPNIKRTNGSIRISRTAAPTTATGTNRFQSVVSKTDDTSITSSISPEVISADMHDRESVTQRATENSEKAVNGGSSCSKL